MPIADDPMRDESMMQDGRHEDLLLRICAAPDGDHAGLCAQLDAGAWQSLADLAEVHRLSPLLRRNIQLSGSAALLPETVRAEIDRACQWHSLYGLRQTVALKRLWETLAGAGFQPLLLKGVALAHGDFPDPALRPMRDVDLLLSRDEAERAQEFLIAHKDYRLAPWAGNYGVEYNHQLPEIQDIEFELTIEIHHRVNARNWPQEPQFVAMLHEEAVTIPILGTAMKVPSPRTNFLHLVEHATLHHTFENGPLTLADLHFLARSNTLDWDWIEHAANRLGLANSLRLVATLAHRLGAGWVPQRLMEGVRFPESHVAAARAALLQDKEVAERNKLLRRLDQVDGGQWGWRAALRKALRPDPYQLADIAQSRPDEMRRWLAYPAWLLKRGMRYRAAMESDSALDGARREADMVAWLREEPQR
ncbi:MAG: nucleotidyltransferase family protein [Novosphingobium sp.]